MPRTRRPNLGIVLLILATGGGIAMLCPRQERPVEQPVADEPLVRRDVAAPVEAAAETSADVVDASAPPFESERLFATEEPVAAAGTPHGPPLPTSGAARPWWLVPSPPPLPAQYAPRQTPPPSASAPIYVDASPAPQLPAPRPADAPVAFPVASRSPDWADEEREADRAPPIRTHRIRDGDTLPRLAERYLGEAGRAGEIYDLNREVILDPELLPIGKTLRMPARGVNPLRAPTSRRLVPIPPGAFRGE